MEYREGQKRKYPIGTGVTEAAAKPIVGVRMKRAGARFSQHGGQTVMLFRAALLSHRFDALHEELHATYTKRVRPAPRSCPCGICTPLDALLVANEARAEATTRAVLMTQ